MSSLSLRLPASLHQKVRELARREAISINQFIATAVAEKAAALLTVDYLKARGRQADARLFDRVLARVPDAAPMPGDELPSRRRQPDKPPRPARRFRRQAGTRIHPALAPLGLAKAEPVAPALTTTSGEPGHRGRQRARVPVPPGVREGGREQGAPVRGRPQASPRSRANPRARLT